LLANELPVTSDAQQSDKCFNPHSPLLANELAFTRNLTLYGLVSIHIRHCWRMNYGKTGAPMFWSEFQSTFAIAGE